MLTKIILTDGGTHGCTMDLFIIITLKEKTGIFKEKLQQCNNVLMDMEVLLCSSGSCCSLLLIMERVGCIGTDLKRAFTSKEEMDYPCCNWMALMCFTVLGLSHVVGGRTYQWPEDVGQLLRNSICDCYGGVLCL